MSTNFYRIPLESEMVKKKNKLLSRIRKMELTPENIDRGFGLIEEYDMFDVHNPWSEFLEGMSIHLGKRSMGWKFNWNFHDNKYYTNKNELLSFIRSGRVMDEYGVEIEVEEFINMSLNWGEPDGLVYNEEYEKKQLEKNPNSWLHGAKYWDKIIDGLRISSSTDFC